MTVYREHAERTRALKQVSVSYLKFILLHKVMHKILVKSGQSYILT